MDQNNVNYGYTPVYHQLQSSQISPGQQQPYQHQQFTILPPQRSNEFEIEGVIQNQTVPKIASNFSPSDIKIEQHVQQYQNDNSYMYQHNYHRDSPTFIPSMFPPPSHHQFQPIWSENNFINYTSQVVPQYPMNYHQPYLLRPSQTVNFPVGHVRQPEPIQFNCNDCNKSFMSATNLKRHLTTKIHFSNVKPDPNMELAQSTFMDKPQSNSTSITDLSEAEVVLIDKIDKELSSIETACWSTSPLPIVSSTTSQSSPDIVEEFRCQVCNKTFAKRCYFTQHNKTAHVGHKPFKCVKCGKKYQSQELLDDHLMKHDGDKPFKCQLCTKSFNHKTDLKRHMILHTTEKPHVCQQCGKGFVRKDHLQKHMASHLRKMEKLKRVFTGNSRN